MTNEALRTLREVAEYLQQQAWDRPHFYGQAKVRELARDFEEAVKELEAAHVTAQVEPT